MPKVIVPIKEEILQAAERRKAMGASGGIAQFLAELVDLGFEYRLRQLYREFEEGKISLGYFAREMGMSVRDLYGALEQRGLPTSNIEIRPSAG